MSGIIWQANIVDTAGNVIPAANVEVRNQISGALVQLFSDFNLTLPLNNPTISDNFGFVRFFVANPGLYRITASKGGFSREWTHVVLNGLITTTTDAALTPPALAAGNNNDWDAGLGLQDPTVRVRVVGDPGGSVLTGMLNGFDGRRVLLTNAGADSILISNESALSIAVARFNMNGDVFWPSGVSHEFIYDGTLSRWSKIGN